MHVFRQRTCSLSSANFSISERFRPLVPAGLTHVDSGRGVVVRPAVLSFRRVCCRSIGLHSPSTAEYGGCHRPPVLVAVRWHLRTRLRPWPPPRDPLPVAPSSRIRAARPSLSLPLLFCSELSFSSVSPFSLFGRGEIKKIDGTRSFGLIVCSTATGSLFPADAKQQP